MKRPVIWAVSLASLLVGVSAIAVPYKVPASSSPINRQVEEVTNRLVGIMDTSDQAATDDDFVAVRMTTCRIRVVEASTSAEVPEMIPFLYQEQALLARLQTPYRQRFLRIVPGTDGASVISLSFKPDDPSAWIGFCDRPEAKRQLSITEVGDPICSVRLVKQSGIYLGNTPPGGCPTNYRGATHITNTIWLFEAGMDTSDRGFDEAGNQVWGAEDKVYQFRRSK